MDLIEKANEKQIHKSHAHNHIHVYTTTRAFNKFEVAQEPPQ